MRRQADGRDDEADQSGGVLEEDRSERRIGRGHHLLDHVTTEQFGRRSGLTNRPQKGDPLEHEGKRQHHVADDKVRRRLGRDQLLDSVRDRNGGAGHEQAERREQGPDVRLAPVAEWMRTVGRSVDRRLATSRNTSLPVSAQECAASASIDADPVTHGRDRLRHSDEDIGAEGDPYRLRTCRPARTRQARKRAEDIRLAVAWLVVSRWAHGASLSQQDP